MEIVWVCSGLFLVYWSVATLLATYHCSKMFAKYSKYAPIQNPDPKWEGFIRDDFSQWNRKKIYIGCLTKFPLTCFVFLSFIFGCIVILYIQSKVGLNSFMRKVVDGYLKFSCIVFGVIGVKIEKEFEDCNLTTPIVICNHTNFFDIFMLLLGVGPLSFMAKR